MSARFFRWLRNQNPIFDHGFDLCRAVTDFAEDIVGMLPQNRGTVANANGCTFKPRGRAGLAQSTGIRMIVFNNSAAC